MDETEEELYRGHKGLYSLSVDLERIISEIEKRREDGRVANKKNSKPAPGIECHSQGALQRMATEYPLKLCRILRSLRCLQTNRLNLQLCNLAIRQENQHVHFFKSSRIRGTTAGPQLTPAQDSSSEATLSLPRGRDKTVWPILPSHTSSGPHTGRVTDFRISWCGRGYGVLRRGITLPPTPAAPRNEQWITAI